MRQRSPVILFLLTMVTCGIYLFVWLVKAGNDTNRLCADVGGKQLNTSMVWLSFVTCGITGLIFYYQLFEKWDAKATQMNIDIPVRGAALMFLCMFIPFFGYYILTETINRIEDACA